MSAQSGGNDRTSRPFIDLKLVAAAVVLTVLAVSLPVVRDSSARVVIALGFVLFMPGYALIAVLFPEQSTSEESQRADSGIDYLERVVLSFGASIGVVALVGFALNFTPWGIAFVPAIVSLSGITFGLIALAAVRRRRVAPSTRFTFSLPTLNSIRNELLDPADRIDTVLNVVLVISLLVVASSVTFAVVGPMQGETFTELSVLTETDSGTLTADNYPTNMTRGDSQSFVVMVTNQEAEQISYTLVVELQRVSVDNGDIYVQESTELQRFSRTLNDNETWRQPHHITRDMTGEHLRLQYLLYRGDAPTRQADDAYRTVHLWLNVSTSNTS
jgi:uncharacterized membrane protein